MKIDGKNILITGASSGIGKELAVQLARRGCRLVLVARRAALLDELKESLSTYNGEHLVVPCDISVPRAIEQACRKIIKEAIELDVLILNAGVGGKFIAANMDLDNFHHQFQVNFWSVVAFVKYLLPPMLERRAGLIAAVSSLAAYRGMPRAAPYACSKAALARFIESVRIDLLDSGVKFVLISPGFVETPLTAKNRFFMPFILPVDNAGRIIIRGLEKEKTEIHFPYRLSIPTKLSQLMPNSLYAWIMRRGRTDRD